MLGQDTSTASPYHQAQSASDSISYVFNMHKECDASCSRYLDIVVIIPSRLWHNDRAIIRWICKYRLDCCNMPVERNCTDPAEKRKHGMKEVRNGFC